MGSVRYNIQVTKQKIRAEMQKSALGHLSIPKLVAVSKQQPDNKVDQSILAGHRVFGENRVQEAKQRWEARKVKHPDLELHLIGPLQTNKVADAVALFDVIEVVDREKLAKILAAEMRRQNRHLPCLVQVNTGEEPQKSGVMPSEVDEFIHFCQEDSSILSAVYTTR